MSSESDIRAGGAFFELYLKRGEFRKQLEESKKEIVEVRDEAAKVAKSGSLSSLMSIAGIRTATNEVSAFTAQVSRLTSAIDSLRSSASSPISLRMSMSGGGLAGSGIVEPSKREIANTRMISSGGLTLHRPWLMDRMMGTSTVSKSAFDGFVRERLIQQQIKRGAGGGGFGGYGGMPSAMPGASPAASAAMSPGIQSPILSAAPATTSAVTKLATATSMLREKASQAGSASLGMAMKFTLAGGALMAASAPFNLMISTFGKSATKVKEYADQHRTTIAEAIIKTNSQLTVDQVRLGVALDSSWTSLRNSAKSAWESISASISSAITPEITKKALFFQGVSEGIKSLGKSAGEWAAKNRGFVSGMFTIGTSLGLAGAAVVGLGTSISIVGASLSAIGGLVAAATSPLVILTAAVAGGGYAWLKYTESGQAALSKFMGLTQPFIQVAKDTIGGITDAITAGNLPLAWDIATTGMKLAATLGLEQLAELAGGLTGDTIATIVSQIASGDMQGAWETSVLAMSAVWDKFSSGVVEVFAAAASGVVKLWQESVTSIANMLLDMSAQGGTMGKIASAIIGTDMQAEIERGNELDQKIEENNRRKGLNVPGKTDALAEAKKNVAESVGAQAGGMQDFIENMRKGQEEVAEKSQKELAEKTKGAERKSRAEEIRRQLDELKSKASGEAAGASIPELISETGKQGLGKGSSFLPTFSAAAAIAMGRGPSAIDKDAIAREQLKETRESKKLAEKQLEADAKMIAQLEKNYGALRFR